MKKMILSAVIVLILTNPSSAGFFHRLFPRRQPVLIQVVPVQYQIAPQPTRTIIYEPTREIIQGWQPVIIERSLIPVGR